MEKIITQAEITGQKAESALASLQQTKQEM